MIILDTNVVSEPGKPQPSERVLRWLARFSSELYVTAVTQAETHYGFLRLPAGRNARCFSNRRDRFSPSTSRGACCRSTAVPPKNLPRSPPSGTKRAWKSRFSIRRSRPLPAPMGAAVATRDTKDFVHTGVTLIDPWTA